MKQGEFTFLRLFRHHRRHRCYDDVNGEEEKGAGRTGKEVEYIPEIVVDNQIILLVRRGKR